MGLHIQTLFETPPRARMSAEEYINDPRSAQKSDLIEGVFVMASPASHNHEDLVSLILTTMRNFVNHYKLGRVVSSNAAYRLSDDNVFQPDISFVRAERIHLAGTVEFPGPPDIAVEIISPSSRQYDTVEKKINYGRFGVQEYWLIDPIEENATFFTRREEQWLPIPTGDGILRSRLLEGYWLRLEWLFPPEKSSRPSELTIAREQGLLA